MDIVFDCVAGLAVIVMCVVVVAVSVMFMLWLLCCWRRRCGVAVVFVAVSCGIRCVVVIVLS